MKPSPPDLVAFKERGYLVARVLDADTVARYREVLAEHRTVGEAWSRFAVSHVQFLRPDSRIDALQGVIATPSLVEACRALLGGGRMVLDGASALVAPPGCRYEQGWHRDIMQVPDDEIRDEWFSEGHFHNNVQINVALKPDSCFWIVANSHSRPLTARERVLFGGSAKMSPIDADNRMSGERIALAPGEAVFYNNNAVHRGYAPLLPEGRLTIHLGFHTDRALPTFHFGVIDVSEYTDEYLQTLGPEVRAALALHVAERRLHPEVTRFHAHHRTFLETHFGLAKGA